MDLKKKLVSSLTAPAEDEKKTLHKNLNFSGLEAYKLLRANLTFMLPADEEKKCPIIGVTSSVRGEGKSTTAVNLCYAIAEAGHDVLLVDADMRLPSVGKKLNISNTPGLSNALVQSGHVSVGVKPSGVLDNWRVLPAGDIPPNPSELLASKRLKDLFAFLAENYDYIVVDLPPVNIVSDALGAASAFDGMIVVVRENYTDRMDLRECIRQLKLADAHILGVALNGIGEDNSSYKYYKSRYGGKRYGKYYKKYGYEEAEVTEAAAKAQSKSKPSSGDTKSV